MFEPYRATQDAPIELFKGKSDGKRVLLSIAFGENGHHFLGETPRHVASFQFWKKSIS